MSPVWALQDAKNSFSEVVERARTSVPQIVTKRGRPAVVVVAWEQYRRAFEKKTSLLRAMRSFPGGADGLDFSRSRDIGREVPL